MGAGGAVAGADLLLRGGGVRDRVERARQQLAAGLLPRGGHLAAGHAALPRHVPGITCHRHHKSD